MSANSLLIACALTLASLSIASAKSYDVHLGAPVRAGSNELKPGDYSVKVEGSEAVFTDQQTSKSFRVPVKVEQNDKKFDYTSVESTNEGGREVVHAIDLGGSRTKLEIAQ